MAQDSFVTREKAIFARIEKQQASMIKQVELTLPAMSRGFHIITDKILKALPMLPETGMLNIFCVHTSCGLALCESWDPAVRQDLRTIFDTLVPEDNPRYTHVLEGSDDMPSHAKSVLTGSSLTIPITHRRLNMGTWQGIQLAEFRDEGGPRHLVLTVYGD
jgi:secondary thiamine-phosphate synthase enzyme